MVSFEIFAKSMPPSLSELKVLPSFCFAFKIPDNVTATRLFIDATASFLRSYLIFIRLCSHTIVTEQNRKKNEMHFNKNKNATHCYLKISNKLFGTFQL